MDQQQLLRVHKEMLLAAKNAYSLVRSAFEQPIDFESKSSSVDVVTEVDRKSQDIIYGHLTKMFPEYKFIGEETAGDVDSLDDDPTFIIDPVDGTCNFVHHNPNIAISLAFFVKKEPQIAVCVSPVHGDFYWAIRGMGTFKNGYPVYVSGKKTLREALISTNVGFDRSDKHMDRFLAMVKELCQKNFCHGIRMFGSAVGSAIMVCEGAADAFFEKGVHIWDYAAAALLVSEAGGVYMDPRGGDIDWCARRVLVASSEELALEIASVYKKYDDERE